MPTIPTYNPLFHAPTKRNPLLPYPCCMLVGTIPLFYVGLVPQISLPNFLVVCLFNSPPDILPVHVSTFHTGVKMLYNPHIFPLLPY